MSLSNKSLESHAPESQASALAETLAALTAAQVRSFDDWLQPFDTAPAFENVFQAWVRALARDPQQVQAVQARYYAQQLALWQHFAIPGSDHAELPQAEDDPRFRAPEWSQPWYDYLRRSYALASHWLLELLEILGPLDMDAPQRRRVAFHIRQFIDAVAPSNFAPTNPEALALAVASGGSSFARGLTHLLADAAKGGVSMSDETAFRVGRDFALTPGAVVYRNELFELLHYRAQTEKVHRRALLIVPPCINKYYILDLRPENSLVRYAVRNQLSVYMLSWRNVPPALARLGWDDYIEAVAQAIESARRISGDTKINTLGFCVGGTLLAATLAVLRRKRRRPAGSLSLLASLIDFADPGEIGVYIDAAYLERCEREFKAGGIMSGRRLAAAFASLRANELVWRNVVEHYLKGRSPQPFDLLYWNSDGADLPGPMYTYYVRHMYAENALRAPDALVMCGVPVDVARIELPSYVLATEADHIVPWRGAYASARLLGSDVSFVLGASGHIAGIVNAPQPVRRYHRTGPLDGEEAAAWLRTSQQHSGSWWPHWLRWIKARSGRLVDAPAHLGDCDHPELEPAPGRYVHERHTDAART